MLSKSEYSEGKNEGKGFFYKCMSNSKKKNIRLEDNENFKLKS